MASLRAALRAAPEGLGPAERLGVAANSVALGSDEEGLFVTVFQCRLEPGAGELHYVDAGHGYAAIRRANGELVTLGVRSLPVGVRAEERFTEGRITLDPGDMLVVYSDGLVERADGTVELKAFRNDLESSAGAEDAVRRLLDSTPNRPADDVTVLVLRRLQTGPTAPQARSRSRAANAVT
jgi:serine phosphatase RsbU (regulator of sigma subunit)